MDFQVQTDDELVATNTRTRRRTGFIIRLFRVMRDNPDLFLLGLIVMFCMAAGWFAARFYLGLTANEIRTEVAELVWLVIFIVTSVATAIGKIFVKQGVISSTLSGRVNNDHDVAGRSIPPKNN